eukprot:PhF_6_TR26335/c0_g1_i1/m.37876
MSNKKNTTGMGWASISVVKGRNFNSNFGVDPFVTIILDGQLIGQTPTVSRTATPSWKHRVLHNVKTLQGSLSLEVYDAEMPPRAHILMGVINLPSFNDGEAIAQWYPVHSGTDLVGEVYLVARRSFSDYGKLLTPPPPYSLKSPEVPPLDLFGECKRNIVRMSNHMYYLFVPYWWLMERWMWTNPMESLVVCIGTTLGLFYGYFLGMTCLAMTVYLGRNYLDRALHQHAPPPPAPAKAAQYPDPFAVFRAFDDLQKQMLFVSIYTNWLADVYEYYCQIIYWERPLQSRKVFGFFAAWTVFGAFNLWPSIGTMLALVNIYMFTLYPLYYNYPHLYNAIVSMSFNVKKKRTAVRSSMAAFERSELGEMVSQIDATKVPIDSTPVVAESWEFIGTVPDVVSHLESGGTICAFSCKPLNEMSDVDKEIIQSFINVSSFANEVSENFVPHIDTNNVDDLKAYTAILTKTMYILPNVAPEKFTPSLIASHQYQNACQPGEKVISPDEQQGIFRFTKTIIKFVFKITVMFKVSLVTDDATLLAMQKCIDPELHHMSIDKVIVLERTKRVASKVDMTAKAKSVLIYRSLPGGVLVTNVTCILNRSLTSMMSKVVNNLAVLGSRETAETAQRTRKYFATQ